MAKSQITKKDEGKCIGLVNGKVVIRSSSINKVMKELNKKYSDKEVSITSIPKGNKVFIL